MIKINCIFLHDGLCDICDLHILKYELGRTDEIDMDTTEPVEPDFYNSALRPQKT